MAAFRHRSHSIIYLVTRRFSRAYLLQIGLLLLTLQSVFEVLQIRTWHMNQSILQSSQQVARAHQGHQHDYGRIFITSLHWNNEAVLPRWSAELVKLVQVLGRENVFVSIFESGSWDASKSLLGGLDERLSAMHVERNITLGAGTHEEFVSQRPGKSKKEGWVKTLRGKEDMRRIPYLASLRNQGLEQLVRLSEAGNAFDKVLYLGDVVFQVEDVLNLLNTNKGEYAAACSLDFSRAPAFYDTFALRDSEGYEHVTQTWPYFRSQKSRKAMKLMEPVPVRSCWNGIGKLSGSSGNILMLTLFSRYACRPVRLQSATPLSWRFRQPS